MFEVYNKKTGSVYKKDIQSNDEALLYLVDARKQFRGIISEELWEIRKMRNNMD